MNRRSFFGAAIATGGFLAFPLEPYGQTKVQRKPDRPAELAGMSLRELREAYRRYLFDDFLPFMDKYVIDHEYGGFMCLTDYTGERESDKKFGPPGAASSAAS